MPGTKPIGPELFGAIAEGTAYTWQDVTATCFIRHLMVEFGEGGRDWEFVDQMVRSNRGRFSTITKAYREVPWSVEMPFTGNNSAGTAVAPRKVLLESGLGLSETVVGATSVTYESDNNDPSATMTLYKVSRDGLKGEYLTGAIAEQLTIDLDTTKLPTMKISGKAARKYQYFATSLAAAITTTDGTSMTVSNPGYFQDGGSTAAKTGMNLFLRIDTEIIEVTAWNTTTGACTIARGALSSTPATHLINAVIYAYQGSTSTAEPTYAEDDGTMVGPHAWTVSHNPGGAGAAALAVTKMQISYNSGRTFAPRDTVGAGAVTDDYAGKVFDCNASFDCVLNLGRSLFHSYRDNATAIDFAITLGSGAGNTFTINLDYVKVKEVTPPNLKPGEIVTQTVSLQCYDTQTAVAGQLQIAET